VLSVLNNCVPAVFSRPWTKRPRHVWAPKVTVLSPRLGVTCEPFAKRRIKQAATPPPHRTAKIGITLPPTAPEILDYQSKNSGAAVGRTHATFQKRTAALQRSRDGPNSQSIDLEEWFMSRIVAQGAKSVKRADGHFRNESYQQEGSSPP
jgi:hypothetical protein